MAKTVKLALIGGFLGAGKTTALIEAGKRLVSEFDKRVAIITNDQGKVLVDTKIVEDSGFEASEVLNGCFCCKFPDFIDSAHEVLKAANPDVILAEPVGSCTDLPATVLAPLRQYYQGEFRLAPLIVLVDANFILYLSSKLNLLAPATPVGYLISHQIREAEVIGINKMDLVSSSQLTQIKNLMRKLCDRAEILTLSAKTGVGLDGLIDQILHEDHHPYPSPGIDYDIYATAESEMGWFNGSWDITAKKNFEAKNLLRDLLTETAKEIEKRGGEIAHLKVHFKAATNSIKASLVALDQGVDFLGDVPNPIRQGSITMNARVKLDPRSVTQSIREALEAVVPKYDAGYGNWMAESISPPPPKPYYRLSE
ncbi:MAG: GTP-binding protein [Candidatus Geothermarchaeales archaeon]